MELHWTEVNDLIHMLEITSAGAGTYPLLRLASGGYTASHMEVLRVKQKLGMDLLGLK